MMKLIATDMDGTFLLDDGTYDEKRLARLLATFKEQGILFVAASGRGLLGLKKLFAPFVADMAFAAENGGMVVYDDQILFEAGFNRDQYLTITQTIDDSGLTLDRYRYLLSGHKASYMLDKANPTYIDEEEKYHDGIQLIPSLEDLDDQILKVTTQFPGELVDEATQFLNDKLPFVHAVTVGYDGIDVIPSGINKAVGLSKLCQHLGIDASQVIAFGDNMNDMEMMTFAGTAIAVSNARPEVQAVADEVIGHHDEASVMTYLERLVGLYDH